MGNNIVDRNCLNCLHCKLFLKPMHGKRDIKIQYIRCTKGHWWNKVTEKTYKYIYSTVTSGLKRFRRFAEKCVDFESTGKFEPLLEDILNSVPAGMEDAYYKEGVMINRDVVK